MRKSTLCVLILGVGALTWLGSHRLPLRKSGPALPARGGQGAPLPSPRHAGFSPSGLLPVSLPASALPSSPSRAAFPSSEDSHWDRFCDLFH